MLKYLSLLLLLFITPLKALNLETNNTFLDINSKYNNIYVVERLDLNNNPKTNIYYYRYLVKVYSENTLLNIYETGIKKMVCSSKCIYPSAKIMDEYLVLNTPTSSEIYDFKNDKTIKLNIRTTKLEKINNKLLIIGGSPASLLYYEDNKLVFNESLSFKSIYNDFYVDKEGNTLLVGEDLDKKTSINVKYDSDYFRKYISRQENDLNSSLTKLKTFNKNDYLTLGSNLNNGILTRYNEYDKALSSRFKIDDEPVDVIDAYTDNKYISVIIYHERDKYYELIKYNKDLKPLKVKRSRSKEKPKVLVNGPYIYLLYNNKIKIYNKDLKLIINKNYKLKGGLKAYTLLNDNFYLMSEKNVKSRNINIGFLERDNKDIFLIFILLLILLILLNDEILYPKTYKNKKKKHKKNSENKKF